MPRNQGTSRKGKPGKADREAGMGKALQRSQRPRYRPRPNGASKNGGGMQMQVGVESIGIDDEVDYKTRSVLELEDVDDFLLQAEMAGREFMAEREGIVVVDANSSAYRGPPAVQWADQTKSDGFVFKELMVPRRPAWDESTTPAELDRAERQAFLEWRRAIALREESLLKASRPASVTPFEKNLEVWRQLWRVLERSSCLLQLVDARNPLFYLSEDLRAYADSLSKPMMVLVNKSDFLSTKQRQAWYDYLHSQGWTVLFFSAVVEQAKLDAEAQRRRREEEANDRRLEGEEDDSDSESEQEHKEERTSEDGMGIDVPLTRAQLMQAMLDFAAQNECEPDPRYDNRIQFGMVGYPNVGKSSVINVLVGSSKHSHGVVRAGVAAQPGKTKHFQTLLLPDNDEMMLCDCPGLVFPSFVSNTADLIAAGVYPIAQMRDHWPVMELICQRIPREIINAHYGIELPVPTEQDLKEHRLGHVPPPTAEEFLTTYCVARSMLAASSGVPDFARAARIVIKDYATGKLLYCHPPPPLAGDGQFLRETIGTALANTKKLRDKLAKSQAKEQQEKKQVQQDESDSEKHAADLIDDDILDLIGGTHNSTPAQPKKKGTKKWGKKDRKNRNKDPYGCHSTPDDSLGSDYVTGSGVIVKGGKHTKKGYTRPTTYAGVRSAASGASSS